MISIVNPSEYFSEEIISLLEAEISFSEKYSLLYSIFEHLLTVSTNSYNALFPNSYSKIEFLLNQYNINSQLIREIKQTHYIYKKIKSNRNYKVSEKIFNRFLYTFKRFAESIEIPIESIPDFNKQYILDLFHNKTFDTLFSESIPELKLYFIRSVEINHDFSIYEFETIEGINIKCKFLARWKNYHLYLNTKFQIAIYNASFISEENLYIVGKESIVVLDPDYLFDVTEIAEELSSGLNLNSFLLNKFKSTPVKEEILFGNIINSIFDDLIQNQDIDFEEAFDKAFKIKPIQLWILKNLYPDSINRIKEKTLFHFENLKNVAPKFKSNDNYLEPSFASPKYGISGRLDLLSLELRNDNSINYIIIELKSGRAPKSNSFTCYEDDNKFQTGLWPNHFAQVTLYNLLIDSTFENRTGNSFILYSSDTDLPLRNAPNVNIAKSYLIHARNMLLFSDYQLTTSNIEILRNLYKQDSSKLNSFQKEYFNVFKDNLKNKNNASIYYFFLFSAFVQREIFASKTGAFTNNDKKSQASLWRYTNLEKNDKSDFIENLQFNEELSDPKNLYIAFNFPIINELENNSIFKFHSFRKGDIVLVYPIDESGENKIFENQLIKAAIKEITNDYILITLRNKSIPFSMFYKYENWVIESDYIDSLAKKYFNSLYKIAISKNSEYYLGIKSPTYKNIPQIDFPKLNSIQLEIVNKAIAANEYFLIQGPPGTGKTSYCLMSLLEYYFHNTDYNILLLAYTNRATDEICNHIEKVSDINYLRLGSKDSSEKDQNLLSKLSELYRQEEIFERLENTRVFVSTTSSVLTTPEIFTAKKFQIAIIDEASQLLEAHIAGIIAEVDKFILIGDEKQLPAITNQNDVYTKIEKEELVNLAFVNYSDSVFERLIRVCKQNNYDFALGMLSEQNRMDHKIMKLANSLFYDNNLQLSNTRKNIDFSNINFDLTLIENIFDELFSDLNYFHKYILDNYDTLENFIKSILTNRVIFINTHIEKNNKINNLEADIIAKMIFIFRQILLNFNFNFAVIAPFRAQCALIKSKIKDQNITVDTVERFQGSERDVIFISLCINNLSNLENISSISLINEKLIDRKLNVAITRAKEILVIVGNKHLISHSPIFTNLLNLIS